MTRGDPALLDDRVARLRAHLEEAPDDVKSWLGLGRALLELDRCSEAVEPLRRAVACCPDDSAAHRDLGRALLSSGAAVEAAEVFARAISLAEKAGDIQMGREIHAYLRRAERHLEPE